MTLGARTIRPPNTWPIDWWPRHTPRIGITPAKRRIVSIEMPASFGVHGPGEITIRAGASWATPSTVSASLRSTRTSSPSSPKYCARFQVNES